MEAAARREFERNAVPIFDNLFGVAMRLTRDPIEAEDLVQDSITRAYRGWRDNRFREGTNFKAWVTTIMRNTFINGYHRRRRKRMAQAEIKAQVRTHGQGVALAHSTSRPPGPEEALTSNLTIAAVREAIDGLSEDHRLAVVLADIEGLSYAEIAQIMRCPKGTVMSRVHRGRKALHDALFAHARELGMVDESIRPPRRRKAPSKATPDTTEAPREGQAGDAVDLSAYRKRRKKA